MPRPPAPPGQLRDLKLLISAHHPVIFLETIEEERAEALVEHVAGELDLLYGVWTAHRGIEYPLVGRSFDTRMNADECLAHIADSPAEALYFLRGFAGRLEHPSTRSRLKSLHQKLWKNRAAVVFSGAGSFELPADIARRVTTITLQPPTDLEYHTYLSEMLRQLETRAPVAVRVDSVDVGRLIRQLRGLTFFEVRKVISQAIAESWSLDGSVVDKVLEAKKAIIRQSGVLEYIATGETMYEVAGLVKLKKWLRKRKAVFASPDQASAFGLTPPKGLMLLGVPGCGKSLCAKAVASEYRLPLVRLDPGTLYAKFVGETERNLRRAMKLAEAMAPVVLWIDEIEKAFRPEVGGGDSGVSQRVLGTFLSWLQDKSDGVFVIATCNDVSGMPPELLRKGRFDEIFFVDLPHEHARQAIFAVHLGKRKRDAAAFDLKKLAEASDGFSGAEIEQAIVSALYVAYGEGSELSTEHVLAELADTRPLSVTMGEKVESLRAWARDRAVSSD